MTVTGSNEVLVMRSAYATSPPGSSTVASPSVWTMSTVGGMSPKVTVAKSSSTAELPSSSTAIALTTSVSDGDPPTCTTVRVKTQLYVAPGCSAIPETHVPGSVDKSTGAPPSTVSTTEVTVTASVEAFVISTTYETGPPLSGTVGCTLALMTRIAGWTSVNTTVSSSKAVAGIPSSSSPPTVALLR